LLAVAEGNRGYACLMPMKKQFSGNNWFPEKNGWELINAETKKLIDHQSLSLTKRSK